MLVQSTLVSIYQNKGIINYRALRAFSIYLISFFTIIVHLFKNHIKFFWRFRFKFWNIIFYFRLLCELSFSIYETTVSLFRSLISISSCIIWFQAFNSSIFKAFISISFLNNFLFSVTLESWLNIFIFLWLKRIIYNVF